MSYLPAQLSLFVDVLEVEADVLLVGVAECGHHGLGKPDGVTLEADIQFDAAILTAIDQELRLWLGHCRRDCSGLKGCTQTVSVIPAYSDAERALEGFEFDLDKEARSGLECVEVHRCCCCG